MQYKGRGIASIIALPLHQIRKIAFSISCCQDLFSGYFMMIQDYRMCASGCSMNRSHQTGCASANYNYIICFLFHKNSFYLSSSKKSKISFVISSISPSGSSSPAFSSVDAVGFTVYTGFSDSESSLFSFFSSGAANF